MDILKKENLIKIALVCLIINVFYTFIMYCKNGNFIPILFDPNKNLDDSTFLRRRLYGIEFWVSFIGAFVMISLL